MNDATLNELKIVVERAVRPIRATMTRKRRVREELLAHLVSVFDEEARRVGDEQTALDQAKRRFGDPRELTGQLQQAVPCWDRCWSVLECMGCQPSESAWHLAAKHFLAMLVFYLLWLPTCMLALGTPRNVWPAEAQNLWVLVLAGLVLVSALFNVILSVVLAALLHKIGPVLARKRRGRIFLAVLCGFGVLCGTAPVFAGAAVLFLLMARQTVKEWHYQEDWA